LDHRRFIFLDESGAKTNMTRLYGRAQRGQRVHDSAPCGRWETTTMIAAVSHAGPRAPFVFNGPIDGPMFLAYVERVLAPTLKQGDILVMDNLSTHKNKQARETILAAGAQIWDLPAYSPDLNPIEKMWSKVKAFLRKRKARNHEALFNAIADALRQVTQKDIVGWFASCGYSIS
jgi:transposase